MKEIEKRRIARFKVGAELLGSMLALPPGSRVIRVEPGDWRGRLGEDQSVELYVESPGLPEVPEDELVPQVQPAVQSNRYAVETLVSAVNHFLRAWESDSRSRIDLSISDLGMTASALAEMKKAVGAVESAGGTLVKFLDWNILRVTEAAPLANGRERDGKAGVWTVKRFADGKVFCEECENEISQVYRRLDAEASLTSFSSPSPFCRTCAGIKADEIVIRLPDFDAQAAASGKGVR